MAKKKSITNTKKQTQHTKEIEGQDLTKGSILKELWSVAWPMMVSMFFYSMYNLVDAFWVSKLSDVAIAAVSISQTTQFMMAALSMGITAGSGVLLAMNIGAKNKPEAERVLGQSFVLSAIAALIFTTISLVFRDQLLMATGANGAIFEPASEYFTITSAGSVLFFMLITVMFAFNAQGDTFTLTKLFAISTLVNVILDPLLIFGWNGLPGLGIAGAAYATLISQVVLIVLAIRTLSHENRMIRFHFYNLNLKWESVKQVLRIGIPASLTQVINPIGLAGLMYITFLGFHEPGSVAFSIGGRMEFLGFLPAIGFGFGGMALIGQSIGAGKISRARDVFKTALKFAFFSAAGTGLLAVLLSGLIIGIFTDDPVITGYARLYILMVALTYGFMAATMVEASAFQAIGQSWPGFWIVFVKFLVIAVPLSYVLTQVFGVSVWGIWLGLALGNIIPAIGGYFWITRTMKRLSLREVPVHG